MKFLLLHGPNLNLLGERSAEHYGTMSLAGIEARLAAHLPAVEWSCLQSNHEGELIDRLQAARSGCHGVLINPGGLSHTSVSLLDAMLDCPLPIAEVHLSQVLAREEFRRQLLTARGAGVVICGMGLAGYLAAADWLVEATRASGPGGTA